MVERNSGFKSQGPTNSCFKIRFHSLRDTYLRWNSPQDSPQLLSPELFQFPLSGQSFDFLPNLKIYGYDYSWYNPLPIKYLFRNPIVLSFCRFHHCLCVPACSRDWPDHLKLRFKQVWNITIPNLKVLCCNGVC